LYRIFLNIFEKKSEQNCSEKWRQNHDPRDVGGAYTNPDLAFSLPSIPPNTFRK
jgi:hypothetical protein